jgi:hypothetical protein
MRQFTSRSLVAGFLILSSVACSIGAQVNNVVTRDEKLFKVTGQPDLKLRTFDGTIEVKSWDRTEVRIEIVRRAPDEKTAAALVVEATQSGDRIVVEAKDPSDRRSGFHFGWLQGSVSLFVTTPRSVRLEARTGDGSIAADGLAGTITLNTGDGSVRLSGIDGLVKVHTGDGSIRIDNAVGSVEADTGDGAIDLTGKLEGLTLKTGDGSIRVHVDGGSALAADWSISTGDGAIDLRVPGTLNAELDAHTGDGQVRADGVAADSTSSAHDRHTLRGRLGSGGRLLRVRSGDGSIVITR